MATSRQLIMTLRQEYEQRGLIIPDDDILIDSEDAFSWRGRDGDDTIYGITRATFTFWRNRPAQDPPRPPSFD